MSARAAGLALLLLASTAAAQAPPPNTAPRASDLPAVASDTLRARAFDYVWYGERPVDASRYARLDPLFARAEDGSPRP